MTFHCSGTLKFETMDLRLNSILDRYSYSFLDSITISIEERIYRLHSANCPKLHSQYLVCTSSIVCQYFDSTLTVFKPNLFLYNISYMLLIIVSSLFNVKNEKLRQFEMVIVFTTKLSPNFPTIIKKVQMSQRHPHLYVYCYLNLALYSAENVFSEVFSSASLPLNLSITYS